METSKSPTADQFTWVADGEKYFLKNNGNTVVEMFDEKATQALFTIDGQQYKIYHEGFWNPATAISNDQEKIVILKWKFWGSNANIEFASGNTFICKIKNAPLVCLSFMTGAGNEILNYKLDTALSPNSIQTIFSIFPNTIPRSELILLIVLGFFSFRGIMIENENSDFLLLTASS